MKPFPKPVSDLWKKKIVKSEQKKMQNKIITKIETFFLWEDKENKQEKNVLVN